ncbi:hypothetical protein ES703_31960 [subsurface metagenome]
MIKKLVITDAHPDNKPKQKMVIELQGGSPWFGYVWLNGTIYTIVEGARVLKIKRTKLYE